MLRVTTKLRSLLKSDSSRVMKKFFLIFNAEKSSKPWTWGECQFLHTCEACNLKVKHVFVSIPQDEYATLGGPIAPIHHTRTFVQLETITSSHFLLTGSWPFHTFRYLPLTTPPPHLTFCHTILYCNIYYSKSISSFLCSKLFVLKHP